MTPSKPKAVMAWCFKVNGQLCLWTTATRKELGDWGSMFKPVRVRITEVRRSRAPKRKKGRKSK
jgi:hypothetical protein